MNREIWKDINNYKGLYQVSNLGRVKRLTHLKKHWRGGVSKFNEKILSPRNSKGYTSVILYQNLKTKTFLIHRLVAAAFLPNPKNKPEVNHINGIKTDNRSENLEWTTSSENSRHALRIGLSIPKQGENIHNSKLTNKQVSKIRKSFKDNPNQNRLEVAKRYQVSKSTIGNIISKKTYFNI